MLIMKQKIKNLEEHHFIWLILMETMMLLNIMLRMLKLTLIVFLIQIKHQFILLHVMVTLILSDIYLKKESIQELKDLSVSCNYDTV